MHIMHTYEKSKTHTYSRALASARAHKNTHTCTYANNIIMHTLINRPTCTSCTMYVHNNYIMPFISAMSSYLKTRHVPGCVHSFILSEDSLRLTYLCLITIAGPAIWNGPHVVLRLMPRALLRLHFNLKTVLLI